MLLGDKNACAVLGVKDLDAAKDFYGKIGLEIESDRPDGVMYKSGDTKVFVYPTQFGGTNQATAAAWDVDDVADCVSKLKEAGVTFEQYDNLPGVTREGDVHIMGDLKAAWFKDPDGNILNIVSGMS